MQAPELHMREEALVGTKSCAVEDQGKSHTPCVVDPPVSQIQSCMKRQYSMGWAECVGGLWRVLPTYRGGVFKHERGRYGL